MRHAPAAAAANLAARPLNAAARRRMAVVAAGWGSAAGGGSSSAGAGRDRRPPAGGRGDDRRGGRGDDRGRGSWSDYGGRGRGGGDRAPPPRPPADPFADPAAGPVRCFATCHPGLEAVVAAEMRAPAVGAVTVAEGRGGVYFSGTLATAYKANLWSRSATRVLQLVASGPLTGSGRGGDRLYALTRGAADWSSLIPPGATLAVDARVGGCTDIDSSMFASTMVRDAVLDAVRDATGSRPPPPRAGTPVDVPLFLAAHRDSAWLYRDMSREPLHKRGYRRGPIHKAALNEAAAAGVLALAGWPAACDAPGAVLADPMCGSGTLLVEAALMARRVAPGLSRRRWAFQSWPDFSAKTFHAAVADAEGAARPWSGTLLGRDHHAGARGLARAAADFAGVGGAVDLSLGEAGDWAPSHRPTIVVTNPPWGRRLDADGRGGDDFWGPQRDTPDPDSDDDAGAWTQLGAFLRSQASPGDAYVVCGDAGASRALRMKAAARHPLALGGADARVLHYKVLPPLERREGVGAV